MLRFTIRDVLWLMVVVGIGVGWWIERTKPETLEFAEFQRDRLQVAIEKEGYTVDWQTLRRGPRLFKRP